MVFCFLNKIGNLDEIFIILHISLISGSTAEELTGAEKNSTGRHVLLNITNAMTDRCSVNKKIVKQLSDKQKQLSNDESVDPINSFYCGVHPLDTLSKAVDKILNSWEKENGVTSSESFKNRGISHTHSLINAVSKVFHKDGAGVPGDIKAFLKSKKVQIVFFTL